MPHTLHPVEHSDGGHTGDSPIDYPYGQLWAFPGFQVLSPLAKLCYYTAYDVAAPGGFTNWGIASIAEALGGDLDVPDIEIATSELLDAGYVKLHDAGDHLFVPGALRATVVFSDGCGVEETGQELANAFKSWNHTGMRGDFGRALSDFQGRYPDLTLWGTAEMRRLMIRAGGY